MTRAQRLAVLTVGVVLTLSCRASMAQEPPPPGEIVRTIQSSQSIRQVLRHLRFEGCPQEEADARAVFDEVSESEIPLSALAELSQLWSSALGRCRFQPLEAWFQRSLSRLTESDDVLHRELFVMHLPSDISEAMRTILWRFVEAQPVWDDHVTMMASLAAQGGVPADRLGRTMSAFQGRNVSLGWIQAESGVLLREQQREFLAALARGAGGFSDDRLGVLLGNIASDVRAGRIDPSDSVLAGLRASTRNRTGIPEHIRAGLGSS